MARYRRGVADYSANRAGKAWISVASVRFKSRIIIYARKILNHPVNRNKMADKKHTNNWKRIK